MNSVHESIVTCVASCNGKLRDIKFPFAAIQGKAHKKKIRKAFMHKRKYT